MENALIKTCEWEIKHFWLFHTGLDFPSQILLIIVYFEARWNILLWISHCFYRSCNGTEMYRFSTVNISKEHTDKLRRLYVCTHVCGEPSFCVKVMHVLFFFLNLCSCCIFMTICLYWSSRALFHDIKIMTTQQMIRLYIIRRRHSPQNESCIAWLFLL